MPTLPYDDATDRLAAIEALPVPPRPLTAETGDQERARVNGLCAILHQLPPELLPRATRIIATFLAPQRSDVFAVVVEIAPAGQFGALLMALEGVSSEAQPDMIATLAGRLTQDYLAHAAAIVRSPLDDLDGLDAFGRLRRHADVADALLALARRARGDEVRLPLGREAAQIIRATPLKAGHWQVRRLADVSLLLTNGEREQLQQLAVDQALQAPTWDGEHLVVTPESRADAVAIIAPRLRGLAKRRVQAMLASFPDAARHAIRAAMYHPTARRTR